jgi:hypothetical protein
MQILKQNYLNQLCFSVFEKPTRLGACNRAGACLAFKQGVSGVQDLGLTKAIILSSLPAHSEHLA